MALAGEKGGQTESSPVAGLAVTTGMIWSHTVCRTLRKTRAQWVPPPPVWHFPARRAHILCPSPETGTVWMELRVSVNPGTHLARPPGGLGPVLCAWCLDPRAEPVRPAFAEELRPAQGERVRAAGAATTKHHRLGVRFLTPLEAQVPPPGCGRGSPRVSIPACL